jgi:hypothetical protein
MRKIESVVSSATSMESKSAQEKQDGQNKPNAKLTIQLSSSVTEVRKFKVPGVRSIYHMSLDQSGRLWASDCDGTLVQTDLQGNRLQKIQTRGGYGYHTVTQDGDFIYTDRDNKVIKKITQVNEITEFIKTGDWTPLSIHSSHINGDILVGMVKGGDGKVTRYNKTGQELQNKGRGLYRTPHYITENINGDVCVSDHREVVVVDKSGRFRFSVTGTWPEFLPHGLCTDVLGNILTCDAYYKAVSVRDEEGRILPPQFHRRHQLYNPLSVCLDGENNLFVGQLGKNKVRVFKYLQ